MIIVYIIAFFKQTYEIVHALTPGFSNTSMHIVHMIVIPFLAMSLRYY